MTGGFASATGIVQGLPDLPDRCVDAHLHIDEDVLTPEPGDDRFARHQFPASFDEQDQQIHRLALEPDGTAFPPQFVALHVELEVAEAKHLTV